MSQAKSKPGATRARSAEIPPASVAPSVPLSPLRPDVRPGALSFNRDLSWLKFNERVLAQSLDERVPLLERVRFLGIFTSNLDEFIMKRVGWFKRIIAEHRENQAGEFTPEQMLATVRATFEHLEELQSDCYERSIRPQLARQGIDLLWYTDCTEQERAALDDWHTRSVFPVLTPLAVDNGHKFPFISNLSQNLGVLVREHEDDEPVFARVKVPQGMPQWIRVPLAPGEKAEPGRGRFVPLYDVIRHNLSELFPGMEIVEVMPFRVTRAADGSGGDATDPDDNLLDAVEEQLKRRRFAQVIRLEVPREASPALVRQLCDMLEIKPEDCDASQGLLDFRALFEIADLPRKELKFAPAVPVTPPKFQTRAGESIFDVIRRGDVLVHHPYESFAASTERFIAEAAADPNVLAIKQTIYRTSRDSPFIGHLIRAAESGKQVACLVEVRARFDEGRNVRLAQTLEKAGVHVAYGVIGLKTHCKAALVVRKESDGLRTYAHLGTGNYNPSTASLYTDVGLFTCDPLITQDAVGLFNLLTGRSKKTDYHRLLVAPATMKPRMIELIERETQIARDFAAGKSAVGGRIIAKMNALEDPDIMSALYTASRAGVAIVLFVRGFCCLRPGVEGLSENIRVVSIVGRFLEHARIFHFGAGKPDPLAGEWYIGSADWMYRNLEQRVECVTPILSRDLRERLLRVFQVMIADRRNAWTLLPDGQYVQEPLAEGTDPQSPASIGTFETLINDARKG
jgi:polyphosphate kinase